MIDGAEMGHAVRDTLGIVSIKTYRRWLTPYAAPIANRFVESWIGSLKRECLNHFFCFALRQLDHIVQTYTLYHNEFRPHQGLGNRTLGACGDPPREIAEVEAGSIRCQRWLSGLLNHYHRRAA